MKIVTNQQEIEYRGVHFTFQKVREAVVRSVPEEQIRHRCIHKKFNPATGEIERKYAWNSIFEDFAETGMLQRILDTLI